MLDPINQLVINFIGDDEEVVLFGNFCDFLKGFFASDCPCWIIGIADEYHFCFRRYCCFNGFHIRLKIILHVGGDLNWHTACKGYFCLIGNKTGSGDDDFITGIEGGGQCQI